MCASENNRRVPTQSSGPIEKDTLHLAVVLAGIMTKALLL